jgi:pseudouridine-5'-phosphate glycosidase
MAPQLATTLPSWGAHRFGCSTQDWRIIMNSRISMKTLSRRLILICAAILINANTVLAANHGADAQMQARDLLAGTVGGRSKFSDKSLPTSADTHQQSYLDPQAQARQLILGNSSVDVSRQFAVLSKTNVAVPVSARRIDSAHTDPQESARRMILGTADNGKESARMRLSGIQKIEK